MLSVNDLFHELRKILRTVKETACRFDSLEERMSELSDKLDALGTKIDAVQTDVDVLKTKSGQLDAEGQAALDRLSGKVDGLASDVGDQDGSDTPSA